MENIIGVFGMLISGIFFLRGLMLLWLNKESVREIIGLNITIEIIKTLIFFKLLILFLFCLLTAFNLYFGYIRIDWKWNAYILLSEFPSYLAVSIKEEFLFRVLLFVGLINLVKNKIIIVLITSFLFSFFHFPDSLLGALSYCLGGIMYGYSYSKFQNILIPIGIHFYWNFIQGVFFGYPVSGSPSCGFLSLQIVPDIFMNGGLYGPEYSVLGIGLRVFIIVFIFLYPYGSLNSKFLHVNRNLDN